MTTEEDPIQLPEDSTPIAIPEPGARIHVRKLHADRHAKLTWWSDVLAVESAGADLVVRSTFERERVGLGCVVLERGDVFVECYWWGRWYTIAQVFAADGALKGWYADVCMPPRWEAPDVLSYIDLDLDVWRSADGAVFLLDEDEFAEHLAAGAFSDEQIAGAERGWSDLRARVEHGDLPELRAT